MYDHLYNKQIYYAYFVWMLWLISLCIAYYVCCTQQKHPSTPIEMESNLCINENPLHQLAHTHKTIRMTNGTQILYKMIRMHYYSKMLVDNGAAWVHFPFDHWVHWNIILCDIDTRALAFESFGAYVCNCYVWHVDLMVMLSRSGKPDKVQYTFNSVYCVGFTRICVFLTLSLSLS